MSVTAVEPEEPVIAAPPLDDEDGRADADGVDDGPALTLPDQKFIPLRAEDLARAIARDQASFGEDVASHVGVLAAWIDRVISQEVAAFADEVDSRYADMNPDRETMLAAALGGFDEDGERDPDAGGPPRRHRSHREEGTLLRQLDYLLHKCSFEQLSDPQIRAAIALANSQGLRVRIEADRVEYVHLWVRGKGRVVRSTIRLGALWKHRRQIDWRRPWRGVAVELDVYKRLVVVSRLTGERAVRLKLFRDIPIADVEALLPHARVAMGLFDQLQVFGGGAGSLGGVAWKVVTALGGGLAALTALTWTILAAFLGLMLRSFLGYRRTKSTRESQRTRHLYEQNLANNASVVRTLLTMLRHEEVKEALLVYCTLACPHCPTESDEAVDGHVEAWLGRLIGARVDFDCPDAMETLSRLGLWADRDARTVVSPAEAVRLLKEHWAERRSEGYHACSAESGDPGLCADAKS